MILYPPTDTETVSEGDDTRTAPPGAREVEYHLRDSRSAWLHARLASEVATVRSPKSCTPAYVYGRGRPACTGIFAASKTQGVLEDL